MSQILRKFKLHWGNWHGRGVHFNEPVQVQMVESLITQSDCKTTIKKRTDSYCMLTHSGKVLKGDECKYTEWLQNNK